MFPAPLSSIMHEGKMFFPLFYESQLITLKKTKSNSEYSQSFSTFHHFSCGSVCVCVYASVMGGKLQL